MAKKVTLETWVDEQLADPDKDKPLSMLTLVHMVGMQHTEVHTTRISPGGTLDVPKLAKMLRGKAEVHSQDLQNIQTYNVLAFWGTTEPQSRYVLLMNTQADVTAMGLATEGPTEQGKTQQGMRWFETGMQQVFRRQQVMDEYSIKLLEQANRTVEGLQRENKDARDIVFQVMKDKIMNDQEFTMKKLQFERSTAERKKWLGFAPALVNNILGKEVFPVNTEDTAIIETIAENIKPEDIAKLSALIPAELAGPLMGRFIRFQEQKEREARDAEDATRSLPMGSPEDDAGGNG